MKTFLMLATATVLCGAVMAAGPYEVAGEIGRDKLGVISHLEVLPGDVICALELNGKITCFLGDGSVKSAMDTGMNNTTAMAVAPNGEIYVFSTLTETKKVKTGARMREVQMSVGVQYMIFSADGKQLKSARLENVKSAKAAKIIDGKLTIADLAARSLVIIDPASGEETGRIKKGLRLCCGIFDFCEAPGNTVAISNLGAFKVQRYDLSGKLISEFGKRGRGLDDFQGCCNPVSAAYLPDGSILTVEKDPTRIKIYNAEGRNAEQIEGVEELVKGCSFIPSAIDSKGTIYLAANTKGYIVKCVPR